VQDFDQIVAFW